MQIASIIQSIKNTKQPTSQIINITSFSGLYCFFLKPGVSLNIFGSSNQPLYAGLSINLNGRELKQHLKSGATGCSSFRRSVGAILKVELNLFAKKRDKNGKKNRADKYKFDIDGEIRLTNWIMQNTELGYWTLYSKMTRPELKILENEIKKIILPSLDLERDTKHLNPLAEQLDALRGICRLEIKDSNSFTDKS